MFSIKITRTSLLTYTNNRLATWYENAKLDYNLTGEGKAEIVTKDGKEVLEITYTENGDTKKWDMPFYDEYMENGLAYFFNCWSECAK